MSTAPLIVTYILQKAFLRHTLAPAAVDCDIFLVRRSAHPRGAFLYIRKEHFPNIKKEPNTFRVSSSSQMNHNRMLLSANYYDLLLIYTLNFLSCDRRSLFIALARDACVW